jgi:hypothetical protein
MGSGSSTGKQYVLRTIDDDAGGGIAAESPQKSARSRRHTAVYPTEQESGDTPDVKPKLGQRRASAPQLTIMEASTVSPGPLSKKASLARMNSKIDAQGSNKNNGVESRDGAASPTPVASSKGMLVQASSRNLLTNAAPAPLISLPSTARMTRSNSVTGRTATVCSLTYPWLLKNASTAGSSLSDFELGRIIGTRAHLTFALRTHFTPENVSPFYYRARVDGDSPHRQE